MMTNNSQQENGGARRRIVALVPLAIGIFIIIAVVAWNARFTVASGEKIDDLGYYKYGYKIEQYYLSN
jgi:hypothetical protein